MLQLTFKKISHRLRSMELPETEVVIGIGTGGIVPASLVAFHLHAELKIIVLNYRDERNEPIGDNPEIIHLPDDFDLTDKRILLVDDVSVSGKTMQKGLELLAPYNVKTLTFKGKADYVLFPEIKECVQWPWKPQKSG
jgi:uncharacterized protein